MTTDWIDIIRYHEIHQDLYEEVDDPTETLTDYLDLSYTICNIANVARSIPFDTFWYLLTTHFEAKSWTNNTIIEFKHLRNSIRTYLIIEEEEEKVEAGQVAFNYVLRALQTIRYKQYSEDDLEDTEYLLVNIGIHTKGYTKS